MGNGENGSRAKGKELGISSDRVATQFDDSERRSLNCLRKVEANQLVINALKRVAGVVGFEPTVHGTKNRCLTAWLHPNCDALVTPRRAEDQAPGVQKFTRFAGLFLRGLARQKVVIAQCLPFGVDDPFQRL